MVNVKVILTSIVVKVIVNVRPNIYLPKVNVKVYRKCKFEVNVNVTRMRVTLIYRKFEVNVIVNVNFNVMIYECYRKC